MITNVDVRIVLIQKSERETMMDILFYGTNVIVVELKYGIIQKFVPYILGEDLT